MEASRIIASLRALDEELTETGITKALSKLSSAATTAAQNPADAASNASFAERVREVRGLLETARSQHWGPSIRSVIYKLRLSELLAPELLRSVNSILRAEPFLLGQAADQLRALAESVKNKADQVQTALTTLQSITGVTEGTVLPDYELGVLLPTTLIEDDLKRVNEQLNRWIDVIDAISELTKGQPAAEIQLSGASTGTFQFFVSLDAEGAIAFLILTGGVVRIFTSFMKAKKMREELASAGYPQKILDDMTKHEEKLIDTAKDEILDELLKDSKTHRQPELRQVLKRSIQFVLKSMNVGVDVEVNSNRAQKETDEATDARVHELQARIEQLALQVNRAVLSLPARERPLLELPPPTDERGERKDEHPDRRHAPEDKKTDHKHGIEDKKTDHKR